MAVQKAEADAGVTIMRKRWSRGFQQQNISGPKKEEWGLWLGVWFFSLAAVCFPSKVAADAPSKIAPERTTIHVGRSPAWGPENAPLTVVLFASFECPYSARVFKDLVALKEEYKERLRLVFKHAPLPFHHKTKAAYRASLAAHKHGKFWLYAEALYEGPRILDKERLASLAKRFEIPLKFLRQHLRREDSQEAEDQERVRRLDIQSIPVFFINGRKGVGSSFSKDDFQRFFQEEEALAQKLLREGTPPSGLYQALLNQPGTALQRQKPPLLPAPSHPLPPSPSYPPPSLGSGSLPPVYPSAAQPTSLPEAKEEPLSLWLWAGGSLLLLLLTAGGVWFFRTVQAEKKALAELAKRWYNAALRKEATPPDFVEKILHSPISVSAYLAQIIRTELTKETLPKEALVREVRVATAAYLTAASVSSGGSNGFDPKQPSEMLQRLEDARKKAEPWSQLGEDLTKNLDPLKVEHEKQASDPTTPKPAPPAPPVPRLEQKPALPTPAADPKPPSKD